MKNSNNIHKIVITPLNLIKKIYAFSRSKLSGSLRLQLIVVFAICLTLAGAAAAGTNKLTITRQKLESAHIDYTKGIQRIDNEAFFIMHRFENNNFNLKNSSDKKEIEEFIQLRSRNTNLNILITDMYGNVEFSAGITKSPRIDIYEIMKNAMELRVKQLNNNSSDFIAGKEYYGCYPVVFVDFKGYFIVSGIPEGEVAFIRSTIPAIPISAAVIAFILMFFILTTRRMKYLEEISFGLLEISKGNLDYKVRIKGSDELASLSLNINNMGSDLKYNIEKERMAEKTKNELITNVSHDLRTPLTSIMGYIGLVRDRRYENELQMMDYLNIVFSKSIKMKSLIEDLFEYTKLTNESIQLEKTEVDINGFIEQIIEELVPACEKEELIFIKDLPSSRIKATVDADKLARVFDNLLMNAIRYSLKPGDITVILSDEGNYFSICIKNKGSNIPEEELKNLFERFYRIDKSRTSSSGGAGLGLSIAKGIVELHGGKIWVECEGNDIRFFVLLPKDF